MVKYYDANNTANYQIQKIYKLANLRKIEPNRTLSAFVYANCKIDNFSHAIKCICS